VSSSTVANCSACGTRSISPLGPQRLARTDRGSSSGNLGTCPSTRCRNA
jgi:hypothetical protein